MAHIEVRKGKKGITYRVLIRRKGYPAESGTFKKVTDAKAWAKKVEGAMEEGRYFPERQARKHTLRNLVLKYTHREQRKEGKVGGNSAYSKLTTREQSKRIAMLDWWIGVLGNPTLDRLTAELISEGREKLSEGSGPSGRPAAPATVNRYLAALSCACTFGRKQGWLRKNPVRDVDRISEPNGRVRFLSDEERERLIAVCQRRRDPRLLVMVVFSISTGARQGEMLGLLWSDVDLDKRVAILRETKNKETRAVPITGYALALLRERSKIRSINKARDFVFANAKGEPTFPREAFEKVLRDAEIEDFKWHDLRHTCASYLAQRGATLAIIAEVLGHKTLAMVKRYSHLTEQHTTPAVAEMTEGIFGEVG